MNETEIRERLRDAVGEAHYPAALKSKVEARLREPRSLLDAAGFACARFG